jgi:sugar O-acyltransferase (sialic acid O-acetyltransferase NeuD family)
MKHLVIVGAGGYGREMYGAALECLGHGVEFDVKGFLDAKPDALAGFVGYPPIIGTPDGYEIGQDDVFITALGAIPSRRRCVAALESRGAKFVALVHKTATIGPNVTVGEGSFIAPHVSITADVSVGRHVSIFHSSSVGHDTRIEDFAHVYAQCSIGGAVTVGTGAAVYPGSVVVPRRVIGSDAVVGAGSAVFVDVDPGVTVLGNPAKPIL